MVLQRSVVIKIYKYCTVYSYEFEAAVLHSRQIQFLVSIYRFLLSFGGTLFKTSV